MTKLIDNKNAMSEYMRVAGELPLLSSEEEANCSKTILKCKDTLIRQLVESDVGRVSVLALFDEVRNGKRSISYMLRKQDALDEGDQKKDRGRTIGLFDAFLKVCNRKYKNESSRTKRLAGILNKIKLSVEDIVSLSGDLATLERLRLAQKRMVEGNLRLVMTVVKGFVGFGIPFEDLVQEGNLGLMRATEDYDYRCGNRFSTYAFYWIRQKVSRYLMSMGRLIRLPANAGSSLASISEMIKKLFIQKQRKPSKMEIATAMGITIEKLDSLIMMSYSPVSLESSLFCLPNGESFDNDLLVGDMICADDTNSAEVVCDANTNRVKLNRAISAVLTPREEKVIRLHFGIYPCDEEMTLEEIAQQVGLSKQGVHQSIYGSNTRMGSIVKLRKYMKKTKDIE